jgi:hypothetical protein
MRLKHMVKDKINYRARGPRTMLTRQTVQGRANDGGLRIGEMERDGILAHGASAFLNESFMVRGDEYYMAVCNKTGSIAIYNSSLNLFLSPFADGPIKFNTTMDGKTNVENISRFGRSFSIVRVPYALKLLMQELQTMNIQMRIITEDNIDQLMNMSYSTNIHKLLQIDEETVLRTVSRKLTTDIASKLKQDDLSASRRLPTPSPEFAPTRISNAATPESPEYIPDEGSPAYQPPLDEIDNVEHSDNSPQYNPLTGKLVARSPSDSPPLSPVSAPTPTPTPIEGIAVKNEEVKTQFDALPERDKLTLMKLVAEKNSKKDEQMPATTAVASKPYVNPVASGSEQDVTSITSILKVPEEKSSENEGSSESTSDASGSSGETKSVKFDTTGSDESSESTQGETKKIQL